MSAQWRDEAPEAGACRAAPRVLSPMSVMALDAVLAVESSAYAFPWSRANFVDSLASGCPARLLHDATGRLLGYFVAMVGVDEMHLLNITIAPVAQGCGHARFLIDALAGLCRERRAQSLWLEVRTGNARARAIYEHVGFVPVGVRKGYYPAPFGQREDAVVMSLQIAADMAATERHALD